jgi:hypothetical protein
MSMGGLGCIGGGVGSARGRGVLSSPGGLGDLSGRVGGSSGVGLHRNSHGKLLRQCDGPLHSLVLVVIGESLDRQGLHSASASSRECDLSPQCATSEPIFDNDFGHRVTIR